jgi:hypothetical protein
MILTILYSFFFFSGCFLFFFFGWRSLALALGIGMERFGLFGEEGFFSYLLVLCHESL